MKSVNKYKLYIKRKGKLILKDYKKEILIAGIFFIIGIITPVNYIQDQIANHIFGEKIDYIYVEINFEANSSNWTFLNEKDFLETRANLYNKLVESIKKYNGANYNVTLPISFENGFALQELEKNPDFKEKELETVFKTWAFNMGIGEQLNNNPEVIFQYSDLNYNPNGKLCVTWSNYEINQTNFVCKVSYKIALEDYSYPNTKEKHTEIVRYNKLTNKRSMIYIKTDNFVNVTGITVKFGSSNKEYNLNSTDLHLSTNGPEKYWTNLTILN